MTTRERHADRIETVPTVPSEADAGRTRERIRETGDAFLEAAAEAIDQALSGDSQAFLAQNRQMGGQ